MLGTTNYPAQFDEAGNEIQPATVVDDAGNVVWSSDDNADGIQDPSASSPSIFSSDYYANLIAQFQSVLVNLDATAQAAQAVLAQTTDPQLRADLTAQLNSYASKKTDFTYVANALNTVISIANNVPGLNFAQIQIPAGLGNPALIVGAAIATAAWVLVQWGVAWINGMNARLMADQNMKYLTPAQQQTAAQKIVLDQSSVIAANAAGANSTAGQIATAVKWGVIALAALLAFKVFQEQK